jgi:uncharacterized protein (DUF2336 family)
MLTWVFGKRGKKKRKKPGIGTKPPYEKAREVAGKGSAQARRKLAGHEDMEPEILYYLAEDDDQEVRCEVAENAGTPLQADVVLAGDVSEEVRCELARKIGRMVPGLGPDENKTLVEMAIQVLQVLAEDELPRVRAIISEELKHADNVPAEIIQRLAEDLEDIVAVPVLEYSPLLNEQDLKQIVARGAGLQMSAIARRRELPATVVDEIVKKGDAEAVQAVLENDTAKIGDKSYDVIAEVAEENTGWHRPMVFRDDLPVRTIRRIASFVNAALMEALIERNANRKDLVENLRKTVRERIERGEMAEAAEAYVPALARAKEDMGQGLLDEKRLGEALAGDEQSYFRYGLVELSGLPHETVSKMLNTGSSKAITALAWKAGLSMAFAEKIQSLIGKLPPKQVLRARHDGSFPLGEEDMDWYLESFFAR